MFENRLYNMNDKDADAVAGAFQEACRHVVAQRSRY